MPVQLPETARLQRHDGGRNGGGDGKGGRVHDAQRTAAARDLLEGVVFGVVYVRGVAGQWTIAARGILILGAQCAVLDVRVG